MAIDPSILSSAPSSATSTLMSTPVGTDTVLILISARGSVGVNFSSAVTVGGVNLTRIGEVFTNAAGTTARGVAAWVLYGVPPSWGGTFPSVSVGGASVFTSMTMIAMNLGISGGAAIGSYTGASTFASTALTASPYVLPAAVVTMVASNASSPTPGAGLTQMWANNTSSGTYTYTYSQSIASVPSSADFTFTGTDNVVALSVALGVATSAYTQNAAIGGPPAADIDAEWVVNVGNGVAIDPAYIMTNGIGFSYQPIPAMTASIGQTAQAPWPAVQSSIAVGPVLAGTSQSSSAPPTQGQLWPRGRK